MDLEDVLLREEGQLQENKSCITQVSEASKVVAFVETERMVVSRAWEKG